MTSDPSRARRQIALLVTAQALLYVNNVALIAVNGLAGLALAPSPLWATLPVSSYIVGSALTTFPASLAMGRFGRRAGFLTGSGLGVVGTSLCAVAMLAGSFALLCAGSFVIGFYNAFAQYLRFAAVDVADAYDRSLKERAVSWVLAGGIAGGIIGPELSKVTRELLAATYAGTFAAMALATALAFACVSQLSIPNSSHHAAGPARRLGQITAQPGYIVAVLVAAVSFGAMSLLMTATPLAMKVCGFGYPEAADVIKWHVVAMFAPGFFTGALIRRLGIHAVMLTGCLLMFGTIGVAHDGITYAHFWIALVLLGLGWNFMFTGATVMLTTTYAPAEKAKAQGINDLAVFLVMTTSSAASGALLSVSGWTDLNLYAAPALALAAAAITWLWLRPARPLAQA
ncbi:MAG TPA: MFS transporter [Burkholderiaceae bacterium]|nr:MFS transporter [Burkholderiaceae bacterium]